MKEFSILHLSDLHIRKVDSSLSWTLVKLLEDIKDQTQNIENIIIVVTGDVIDKGEFNKFSVIGIDFFQKLYDYLNVKIIDIFFVPGNHDKVRNKYDEVLLANCKECEDCNLWNYHEFAFKQYIDFINKVYDIYGKKHVDCTFGVETVSVNDCNLAVISVNTAWCAKDDKDKRNLRVGKHQLDELKKSLKIAKLGKKMDLTIVLAHHPLTSLLADEEDVARFYFMKEDHLLADIFMCGHLHDRTVSNWYNHNKSLVTLVTGVGGDNQIESVEKHRYSIYNIICNLNTLEIIMRTSNTSGSFDYDYSVYTHESDKKSNKLHYPIISNGNHTYFELPTHSNDNPKIAFPSRSLLNNITKYSQELSNFGIDIGQIINIHKIDFINNVVLGINDIEKGFDINEKLVDYFFYNKEDEPSKELVQIFNDEKDTIYGNFDDFLCKVCDTVTEIFRNGMDEGDVVRGHFRWYEQSSDQYKQICVRARNSSGDLIPDKKLRDVPWEGSMIKDCFSVKKSLVYSVNASRSCFDCVEWDDFITIVPQFDKSETHRAGAGKKEKRPLLTFGISCKMRNSSEVLHILNYLEMDKLISSIIEGYIKSFPFELKDFIKHLSNKS